MTYAKVNEPEIMPPKALLNSANKPIHQTKPEVVGYVEFGKKSTVNETAGLCQNLWNSKISLDTSVDGSKMSQNNFNISEEDYDIDWPELQRAATLNKKKTDVICDYQKSANDKRGSKSEFNVDKKPVYVEMLNHNFETQNNVGYGADHSSFAIDYQKRRHAEKKNNRGGGSSEPGNCQNQAEIKRKKKLTKSDRELFAEQTMHEGEYHSRVCCSEVLREVGPEVDKMDLEMGFIVSRSFILNQEDINDFTTNDKMITADALFILMFGKIHHWNVERPSDRAGLLHPMAVLEMFHPKEPRLDALWERTAFFRRGEEPPTRILIPVLHIDHAHLNANHFVLAVLEKYTEGSVVSTVFDSLDFENSNSRITDQQLQIIARMIYSTEISDIFRVPEKFTTPQRKLSLDCGLCVIQNMNSVICLKEQGGNFHRYLSKRLTAEEVADTRGDHLCYLEKWWKERTKCDESADIRNRHQTAQKATENPRKDEQFQKTRRMDQIENENPVIARRNEEIGKTRRNEDTPRKTRTREQQPVEFTDKFYDILVPDEFANHTFSTRQRDFIWFLECEVKDSFDSSCREYPIILSKNPVVFRRDHSYQYKVVQTVRLVIHGKFVTVFDPFLNPKEDNEVAVALGEEGQPIPFERQLICEHRRYKACEEAAIFEPRFQFMEYVAEVIFSEGYMSVVKLLNPLRRVARNEQMLNHDREENHNWRVPRRRRCRSLPPFVLRDVDDDSDQEDKFERKDFGPRDDKKPEVNDDENMCKPSKNPSSPNEVTGIDKQSNTHIDEIPKVARKSGTIVDSKRDSRSLATKLMAQKQKSLKEEEAQKDRMDITSSGQKQMLLPPHSTSPSDIDGPKATAPVSSLFSPLNVDVMIPNMEREGASENVPNANNAPTKKGKKQALKKNTPKKQTTGKANESDAKQQKSTEETTVPIHKGDDSKTPFIQKEPANHEATPAKTLETKQENGQVEVTGSSEKPAVSFAAPEEKLTADSGTPKQKATPSKHATLTPTKNEKKKKPKTPTSGKKAKGKKDEDDFDWEAEMLLNQKKNAELEADSTFMTSAFHNYINHVFPELQRQVSFNTDATLEMFAPIERYIILTLCQLSETDKFPGKKRESNWRFIWNHAVKLEEQSGKDLERCLLSQNFRILCEFHSKLIFDWFSFYLQSVATTYEEKNRVATEFFARVKKCATKKLAGFLSPSCHIKFMPEPRILEEKYINYFIDFINRQHNNLYSLQKNQAVKVSPMEEDFCRSMVRLRETDPVTKIDLEWHITNRMKTMSTDNKTALFKRFYSFMLESRSSIILRVFQWWKDRLGKTRNVTVKEEKYLFFLVFGFEQEIEVETERMMEAIERDEE